jgi:hypothetical protein
MTLYHYLQLNEIAQANAVWDIGKFLAHRKDAFYDYALYRDQRFLRRGDLSR